MSKQFDQLSLELPSGSLVARGAIAQWNRIQFGGLHTQLVKSGLTAVVGVIGTALTQMFIAFGPGLTGDAAVFSVFMLLLFAGLAIVGILTLIDPIVALFAHQRLRDLQNEMASYEVADDADWLVLHADLVASAFKVLISSTPAEMRDVAPYRAQMEDFIRLHSRGHGTGENHDHRKVA